MGHNFPIDVAHTCFCNVKVSQMSFAHVLFYVLVSAAWGQGRKGIGGSEQDWGYITVRPNAHMFWWLYYTTYNNISNYTDRPLIIWLQGGPGMTSSGYGNFVEIGPLDPFLKERAGSFVEDFNVLFVDNPVGVGYSYISDNKTHLAANGDEIVEDLFNFFKEFISSRHSEFRTVPVYVFGESYGGKMATEFVYHLLQKEKSAGKKLCNLKGLALGDAYISPMDYLNHYGSLALNLGLIDKRSFTRIDEMVKRTQLLINKKEFRKASEIENEITDFIVFDVFAFDMNNFLAKINSSKIFNMWIHTEHLDDIMNAQIKDELNITADVTWSFFNNDVYDALRNDLMKSVVHKVEAVLNSTDVKVIVYSGILDFLVNTAGTMAWLDRLQWTGRENWLNSTQIPLLLNELIEGFSKKVENLAFYAVLRAGHSVPYDNLPVMNEILRLELLD